MALKAEITEVTIRDEDERMLVSVRFYDDGAPDETIRTHTFTFALAITAQDARNQIQAYGVALKARLEQRVAKAAEYVGTVINIP
jgi:hypothetical protein